MDWRRRVHWNEQRRWIVGEPSPTTHEGEHMQEGWYRFWAAGAWRSWMIRRREWRDYSRRLREMRGRLLALAQEEQDAVAVRRLAERNERWVSDLRPCEVPIRMDEGEVGLATVTGVHLLAPGRSSDTWKIVDRGVVYVTNRRLVFSGASEVSLPLWAIAEDVVRKRGWELHLLDSDQPVMLAGPVERLMVLAEAVVDGIEGIDPRARWGAMRSDAMDRLGTVAHTRNSMGAAYHRMRRPVRPISPVWMPAGALAAVAVIALLVASEPPPPAVMSVQITTTTAATAETGAVADGAGCHASYAGRCVPAGVSDVDCSGSDQDGPYFTGEVDVIGPDQYELDPDGDGVACEPGTP